MSAQINPMLNGAECIWTCKVGGPANHLPHGADSPMRKAVQDVFAQLTGRGATFCFSGWGGQLTEPERAVVENRLPSPEFAADCRLRDAAPELLEALKHALRWHDQLSPDDREKMRAAIAKATGSAQ